MVAEQRAATRGPATKSANFYRKKEKDCIVRSLYPISLLSLKERKEF
jgi:hypothetical protein